VFPALTVRENLMAGAYLRKDKPGIANDIEQQLHRFPPLRERIGQLAGTLSGGEQQMLAVGRALMSRPRLLMMDEPSVGLAPKVVAEIFGIIQKLHHEGTTIFLVEQNVHMAMKVAQHFYLLQQGRVTFSGTPDQLAGDDLVKRAYLAGHSAAA
jgi:branched-chain amino acid transport system ATP-binding protein